MKDINRGEKTIKILSIIALIVSVLGLTIAFAAVSKNAELFKEEKNKSEYGEIDNNGTTNNNDSSNDNSESDNNGLIKKTTNKNTTTNNTDNNIDDNSNNNNNGNLNSNSAISTWNIHFANLSKAKLTGKAKVKSAPELSTTFIEGFTVSLLKPGDSVSYEFDIVNKGTIDAKINFYNDSSLCNINTEEVHCDWDGDGKDTSEDLKKIKQNIIYRLYYSSNNKSVSVGDILKAGETKHVVLKIEYNKDTTEFPVGSVSLDKLEKVIQYVQK